MLEIHRINRREEKETSELIASSREVEGSHQTALGRDIKISQIPSRDGNQKALLIEGGPGKHHRRQRVVQISHLRNSGEISIGNNGGLRLSLPNAEQDTTQSHQWAAGAEVAPSAWHMNRFERAQGELTLAEPARGDLTEGVDIPLQETTPLNPIPNHMGNPKLW